MKLINWIINTEKQVKRNRILAGHNVDTEETPNGTFVHAKAEGVEESKTPETPVQAYYCKVIGRSGALYAVSLYKSPDGSSVGTGYAMPTMLHISEEVPTGTWFVANATTIQGMAIE